MNTIKNIEVEGKKFGIRSLTRGEIKELGNLGYTYFGCVPSMENAIEAQDRCLEMLLDSKQINYLDSCSVKAGTNQEQFQSQLSFCKITHRFGQLPRLVNFCWCRHKSRDTSNCCYFLWHQAQMNNSFNGSLLSIGSDRNKGLLEGLLLSVRSGSN